MPAVKGKDTVLEYGNTADIATATTWTAIATVKSIKPAKKTNKEIDTTHLLSSMEESIPGLSAVGECEATLQYDSTQAETLEGFFATQKAWRVRYNGGTTGRKFNGWISEDGEEEVVNGDIIMQTVKIHVTGDIQHFTTA